MHRESFSFPEGPTATWVAVINEFSHLSIACCVALQLFGCFITMLIFSSFFTSMFGLTAALALWGPGSYPDGTVPCLAKAHAPEGGAPSTSEPDSASDSPRNLEAAVVARVPVTKPGGARVSPTTKFPPNPDPKSRA